MLSEHSSDRLGFPIRKGGKNADLIGKESLWIYTVKKREKESQSWTTQIPIENLEHRYVLSEWAIVV